MGLITKLTATPIGLDTLAIVVAKVRWLSGMYLNFLLYKIPGNQFAAKRGWAFKIKGCAIEATICHI